MNTEQIKMILQEEILELAPEADLDLLDMEEDMREELDLDSMDFLRLCVALGNKLGFQIPDSDLAKILSFESMLTYLTERSKA